MARACADLLVDQGDADNFLAEQLKTASAGEACERRAEGRLRMQPGYDHSYYFISTFMDEHVAWHAERLKAAVFPSARSCRAKS